MPIAELFLSAFLQVLFDRLASRELLHFARRKGIEKLMKNWEENLISINQVLDDAEDKQLNGDLRVKSWLERLRNLAYDIEDLLDEFATESTENKSKAEPSTSKVRFLLPSCCFNLSPRAFMFNHTMQSKIRELDGELQHIKTLKDNLGLTENRQQSAHCSRNQRFHTTDFPEEIFIGREEKIMEILKLMFREEDEVIPIVGMAGLGKTALAKQVFHHDRVTDYFDVRAWAYVSYNFDESSIAKSILETTNPELASELHTFSWKKLQNELYNSLLGKRFLVVLDDVWEKRDEKWNLLLNLFRLAMEKSEESKGSKIIITTRDFNVASVVDAKPITLEVLSPNDCMTLFEHHLLKVKNFDHHHNLEVFGQKMVEKCNGLPLGIKALVGVLRPKGDPREWEKTLNNKFWGKPKGNDYILPVLRLSYLDLPSHLRRCFAYCAIFPKNYEIQQDELIHWLIAEGLVEGKKLKNQWDEGLEYFQELVNRSLFLKSSSNGSRFLMHDLMNDLAKLVASETCFDLAEFKGARQNVSSSARHASFISNNYIHPKKFEIYHGMKRLRSFISLPEPSKIYNKVFVSQKVLCDLLSALKYLRVLSLSHYQITEVPESIGKLRHLRHLNLSYTKIKTLPKSIVALYNLKVLMLRGCEYLLELPEGIEKLINLRFLDIADTTSLEMMPLYIGKLVDLEMLSKFIVGMRNGSRLEELKDLKNLGGELCIFDLHMVQEATDANDANLCAKKGICRLTLQWNTDFENSSNEELERKVLNFLCPHQNLENLTISYYGGLEFPSWLGSPSHDNIVYLRLHGCRKVKALPSLGQLPSLKELFIKDLDAICTVGSEFYGSNSPFPSLITLEFTNMPSWKEWSRYIGTEEVGVIFPHLEHLVICNCPKLIGRLPSQLNSLIKLQICSCPQMDALCMDASPFTTSLPSLNELDFVGCNEGVLKSLVTLTSLTTLVISDVPELTCLNHGFTSSLSRLEQLRIQRCEKLKHLWQDKDVIQDLACLKSLDIESCPELVYFVAKEGDIELSGNLETMKLTNCLKLEKLPSKVHAVSSLRSLTVNDCPKLMSFSETGIPTSMISLYINRHKMLQSLPRGLGTHLDEPSSSTGSNAHSDMTSCLEDLRILGCNSLPASPFSEGRFLPRTLKLLEIGGSKGLESLAEINVDSLQSLQEILLRDCEKLRNLPHGLHTLSCLLSLRLQNCPALELECFPRLPANILRFVLRDCPKIKSLPNQLDQLKCLYELEITNCKSITRFPNGGLPPQLETLFLEGCENIEQPPLGELLAPLTSLEWLYISGSVGGAGEEEDLVLPLPSSLLHLDIWDMGKVETLSSRLPLSLRSLVICNCQKLRELGQLPPSLEKLDISYSRTLEKRCREPNGDYWPRICEIPCVKLEEEDDYSESQPSS